MLDATTTARLRRLMRWLDQFKPCFGHRAQHVSLRRYLQGLLSDSGRKSMQAMLARVTEPGSYQAFQHFITHAPWDTECVWRRLLALGPDRRGILILDSTGFPKQGTHSVGVARQYCGAVGKIANCQVAVTAALWNGVRAWLVGAQLYLPESWATDPVRRAAARIPRGVGFQEKWRLALTLIRRVRAAQLQVTAVIGDAEFGDVGPFRTALHRLKLPYALGISHHLTVFRGTPAVHTPARTGRRGRPGGPSLRPPVQSVAVDTLARGLPAQAWRRIQWRNGSNRPWAAEFAAVRVTPASEWRHRRLLPELWLLCERGCGATARRKYYFIHLPPTSSLRHLVQLAHQRWAIEQQYQDLKDELGIDHFEGRSYPGWHHHVVLSAIAYAFVQHERRHGDDGRLLTFPVARAIVQEIFTAYLFAQRPHYLKRLDELRTIELRI